MKDGDLAAIAIATAVAAGAGLAVYSVKGTDYYCPPPSAASVATLFAPCQAFDTAMGHKVTKKEAVQMGLLTPDEQSTQPATRLAGGSAASEWINPKAASVSMQIVMRKIL
jgi:hypothetical protein